MKTTTYRNVKKVNSLNFSKDVQEKLSTIPQSQDMKETITNYNRAMTSVMDKHAPLITKTIRIAPHAPWFDAEYADLRRKRRKAEKMLRKTGNEEHENEYNILRKQTTLLAQSKKKTYINDKLSSDISSKDMYTVVNKLLDNNHEPVLPSSNSDLALANDFKTYFTEKVNKIRPQFLILQYKNQVE